MAETQDTFHIPDDRLQAFIDAAPDAATVTIGREERYVSCMYCKLNIDCFIPPGPDEKPRVMTKGEIRCPECGNVDLYPVAGIESVEKSQERAADEPGYHFAIGEYVVPKADELLEIIPEALRLADTAFSGSMNYEQLELSDRAIVGAILAAAIYMREPRGEAGLGDACSAHAVAESSSAPGRSSELRGSDREVPASGSKSSLCRWIGIADDRWACYCPGRTEPPKPSPMWCMACPDREE